MINDLIEVLVKIRKKVREKDLKDIEIFADPLFDGPRQTKLRFLDVVGSDIRLDELYTSFFDLDTQILSLVKEMVGTKPDQEKTKGWIGKIDELEKNKRKLEERFRK